MREKFLANREDMERRGAGIQLGVVYINGDAYIDHPGFAQPHQPRIVSETGAIVIGHHSQPTGIWSRTDVCSRNWDDAAGRFDYSR